MSFLDKYEFIQGEYFDVFREPLAAADDTDQWFIDTNGVKVAGYNIELWDAATGGTQLIFGTDYSLVFKDTIKSSLLGQDIFAGFKIENPTYERITLYLDIRQIGGYTKYTGYVPELEFNALDTTAGDIAVTMPSAPQTGDSYQIWNSGTGGNYVTGLPDSIKLGDNKGIRLTWIGQWRYEDVIIEERDESDQHVTKWASGRMEIRYYGAIDGVDINVATGELFRSDTSESKMKFTYIEPFVSNIPTVTLDYQSLTGAKVNATAWNNIFLDNVQIYAIRTTSSSNTTVILSWQAIGKWK